MALAVEVDSEEHHADADGWRRTLARQRRYAEHGVVVMPVTPRELVTEPDAVARSIVAAYRLAAGRPRPAVRLAPARTPGTVVREPRRWGG